MTVQIEYIPCHIRGSDKYYVGRYGTPEKLTGAMTKKKALKESARLMGMSTNEYMKLYRKVAGTDD